MHRLMINLLIVVGTIIATPLSWAALIPIAGIGTQGGSFTGSLDYNATSPTMAVLDVKLINTSAGFLSGLALNNPGNLTGISLVTPPTPTGFNLFGLSSNGVNAAPLGGFDFGAGTGTNWEGGTPPALAAGGSATFRFDLVGTNLNVLTTNSFTNAFSLDNKGNPTDNFLAVRFQGLGEDGKSSDKVSASVVPLPAAAWLFSAGVVGLAALARRRTV